MNLQVIAELIAMMEASTLTVMEVEAGELRVRLENNQRIDYHAAVRTPDALPMHQAAAVPNAPAAPEPTINVSSDETVVIPPEARGGKEVRAPMVGTFHVLADNPITSGMRVAKGQPVCMIEAMKLMNEITVDEDAEILWVALDEGAMVEYGQLLYLYK